MRFHESTTDEPGCVSKFVYLGHSSGCDLAIRLIVIGAIGGGKEGSAIRADLRVAPYGWPQDAIDAVLLALLRGSGQVLSRQRLEQALYGFDEALDSNALEVHMHHLRRKLGEGLVKTVRGVGYFVPVPEAQGGT